MTYLVDVREIPYGTHILVHFTTTSVHVTSRTKTTIVCIVARKATAKKRSYHFAKISYSGRLNAKEAREQADP